MGFLAWLHYASRIVLLFFYRLRRFRLVKAQSAIVCPHIVEIRVIFISPRSCDRRLCAIVIRVRTPSTFIAAMKPSTVRCAITNELLRRRKQTACDNTIRYRPDHLNHVELLSVTFEEILADTTHLETDKQLPQVHAHVSTAGQGCSAEATGVQSNASDKITPTSRPARVFGTHTVLNIGCLLTKA
jgi:hypothetical protein